MQTSQVMERGEKGRGQMRIGNEAKRGGEEGLGLLSGKEVRDGGYSRVGWRRARRGGGKTRPKQNEERGVSMDGEENEREACEGEEKDKRKVQRRVKKEGEREPPGFSPFVRGK